MPGKDGENEMAFRRRRSFRGRRGSYRGRRGRVKRGSGVRRLRIGRRM